MITRRDLLRLLAATPLAFLLSTIELSIPEPIEPEVEIEASNFDAFVNLIGSQDESLIQDHFVQLANGYWYYKGQLDDLLPSKEVLRERILTRIYEGLG